MQRATKLPVCDWGFDYLNGSWTPVWFVMQAKLLSQLNRLQAKREMAHGDSRIAVNAWPAGFVLRKMCRAFAFRSTVAARP
jgi:hypothetical protein